MSLALPAARSSRTALAALSLCVLTPSLAASIANTGLPALSEAFGAPFAAVQGVVLAYLAAVTALVVVAGRLGDRLGRRRLLLAGIALFTLASGLCALAPSLPLLVAARGLQGAGAAVMMALGLALAGEAVPREKTGAAMGLLGTMSAAGTAMGPALGGVLTGAFGWPALFLVCLPAGAAALLLAARALPADAPGAARAVKLLDPAVLTQPGLAAGLAVGALVAAVMMATLVVGPFYLSQALGLSPAMVGLTMSAGPLAAALAGAPAGRLVDRLGARPAALAGLTGMAVGLIALCALPLAALPRSVGSVGYAAAIVVVTVHYALLQAANTTAVMTAAGSERRGVVSGLLNLSRNLGFMAGAAALGQVFALAAAAGGAETGMRAAFAIAAALVFAALTVAAALREPL